MAALTPREQRLSVIRRLCQRLGPVSVESVMTGKRVPGPSQPAYQAAALVLIERHGLSSAKVGQLLGREHSSILHACKNARARIARDPVFAAVVAEEMQGAALDDVSRIEERRMALDVARAAARAAAERVFLASQLWCRQCESRVTGAQVRACAGRCDPEVAPVIEELEAA